MNGGITHQRLLERLHYEPDLGVFWHKPRPEVTRHDRMFNTRFADRMAGNLDGHGYVMIRVDGEIYKAHQLAWFYMTGQWPVDAIDHRNRSKIDNSFVNLREATKSQNMANTGPKRTNSTGFKGVYQSPSGKFISKIKFDGKENYLGTFETAEKADAVYRKKAKELFGEFAV